MMIGKLPDRQDDWALMLKRGYSFSDLVLGEPECILVVHVEGE